MCDYIFCFHDYIFYVIDEVIQNKRSYL